MKNQNLIFSILFVFILFGTAYGQLGIKTGYSLADNSAADEYLIRNNMDFNLFRNNFSFGIIYQYVIEGKGLSLLPGFVYTLSKTHAGLSEFTLNRIGFELPFKIFPFNMEGDCNCPDFSLRNKFFEKHFFLMLNTGFNFSIKSNSFLENSRMVDINYKLGIGAGVSIPLAKNMIFSPGVNYNWFFDDKWEKDFLFTNQMEDIYTSCSELDLEFRLVYVFEKR